MSPPGRSGKIGFGLLAHFGEETGASRRGVDHERTPLAFAKSPQLDDKATLCQGPQRSAHRYINRRQVTQASGVVVTMLGRQDRAHERPSGHQWRLIAIRQQIEHLALQLP